MSKWKPIETAPKDGTNIWMFLPDDDPQQAVGYFCENVEYKFWAYKDNIVQDVCGIAYPTHWMPLPQPPK